jgi:hypothetical protein
MRSENPKIRISSTGFPRMPIIWRICAIEYPTTPINATSADQNPTLYNVFYTLIPPHGKYFPYKIEFKNINNFTAVGKV